MTSLVENSAVASRDSGRQKIELAGCVSKQRGRITLIVGTLNREVGVVIRTLAANGFEVRVCTSHSSSPVDDEVAAALAGDGISVFAKKDQSIEEHLRSMVKALNWSPDNPDAVFCLGPYDSHFFLEGLKAEELYKKTGEFPDPSSADDAKSQAILTVIRDEMNKDPNWFHRIYESRQSQDKQIVADFESLHSTEVKANPSRVTFIDYEVPALYFRISKVPDLVVTATNGNMAGMKVVVWGYGDAGKECTAALIGQGAHVAVHENGRFHWDDNSMLWPSDTTHRDPFPVIDMLVFSGTGGGHGEDTIGVGIMKKMKDNSIVCNIGGSYGGLDMTGLEDYPDIKCLTMSPGIDKWVFPDGPSIIILAQGRPMKLDWVPARPDVVELSDDDSAMAVPSFDYSGSLSVGTGSPDGGCAPLTSEEMGLDMAEKITCLDTSAWLMIVFFVLSAASAYFVGVESMF